MMFGADISGIYGMMLKRDTGGDMTWNHYGTTWTAYAAAGVMGDGTWHNYVLTYQHSGAVQHFYIDGVDTDTWMNGSVVWAARKPG